MKDFQPKWLRIEKRALDYPAAQDILEKCADVAVDYIDDWKTQAGRGFSINQRFKDEKNGIILAVKDGALVKSVDRDLYRENPNEFYIIHSMGCPYDCQYCFLFDYLDNQIPTIFVNIDDILRAVETTVNSEDFQTKTALHPGVFHAGEFSDALAFDHLTNLSAPLVQLFGRLENARLELRTKSDNIENLLDLEHRGKTTVSWTFSPQATAKNIEFHTASLDERIAAAKRCQEAGYPIGLRFDPIVYFDDWENGFEDMILCIFAELDPAGIQDCSLGIYRATPGLNNIVRRRFPRSKLHLGEMEQAGDGKYRYIRPVRVRMLKKISALLRSCAPNLKIELCMESPEVEGALLPHIERGEVSP